jgi:hypothetical protein
MKALGWLAIGAAASLPAGSGDPLAAALVVAS